jgi:hypothetical protein
MMDRIFGSMHPSTIRIASAQARIHMLAGRPAVAESIWRREVEYSSASGTTSPINGLGGVALALEAQGRLVEADSIRQRLIAFRSAEMGPHSVLAAIEAGHMAWLRHLEGRDAAAERLFLAALADLENHMAPAHYDIRRLHRQLAAVYAATGRPDDAARHRELARPR